MLFLILHLSNHFGSDVYIVPLNIQFCITITAPMEQGHKRWLMIVKSISTFLNVVDVCKSVKFTAIYIM